MEQQTLFASIPQARPLSTIEMKRDTHQCWLHLRRLRRELERAEEWKAKDIRARIRRTEEELATLRADLRSALAS